LNRSSSGRNPAWFSCTDTNTTLAGALTAAKLHIPLAHVEAGLRSFDRSMPEEINRVITDRVSDLLFCPTPDSVRNLGEEGCTRGVHLVGDVMVDALLHNRDIAEKSSRILEDLGLQERDYIVATVHRQGNTDSRVNLGNILQGLGGSGLPVIFPAHPRTIRFLKQHGLLDSLPGEVRLIEPLGYIDMVKLMAHARKIVTDSGGVQKEAYLLRVPCITLRENTEWTETVESGWNLLVGTDPGKIHGAILTFDPQSPTGDLYGKGDASRKITSVLRSADFSCG
jgi:UDP-GlcNAc3NAcA epimerase